LAWIAFMEEVKIFQVAAGIGFTLWRRDDCHLTKARLQAGFDQSCQS
jgi:hypothetical protein